MTLTAVFFDAGNTLVSLDYAAIVDVLAGEGFRVTRDEVWRAECRARVKLDPFLAQAEVRESREVFSRYMRTACEEMGISWGERAERILGRLSEINRREGLWRGGAMPGAREVLAGLKGKGYVVGVISNSDGRLETLVRDAGLAGSLDVIIDSRVVGVEKPDPRIFHLALERTGVAPHEAIYVGDFYSLDVVGARRAGLEAILLDPLCAWPQLDCVKVQDLFEVPGLVLPNDGRSAPPGDRLTPA
ncbi:MAG TPA: HAD family hydrolase [Candidatus Methylomirabilis sp.]|nr:HAD family hydrolase [Candidatus Methylomirabilis sp.]